MFPSGPKYVIGNKTENDTMYGSKIKKNQSPGPGTYQIRRQLGGTHQTFGIKFKHLLNRQHLTNIAGPGSYNITQSVYKKEPVAIFGTSIRNDKNAKSTGPDPTTYNYMVDITSRRSNSREKNSARAVFGKAIRNPIRLGNINYPGP